jgi:membrane protein DedA with SNARE-associated domain
VLAASLIDTVTPWFRDWGLLIVFLATFIESSIVVASIFPGESILLLAGFFASPRAVHEHAHPVLNLPQVVAVAFAGALVGDVIGYTIGRIAGRPIVRRFGRYFFLPERRLPVLEGYIQRYGKRAILLGRFAPFLRSIRTLVAGTARMPFGSFVVPDIAGAAIWSTGIALTGFVLGESWEVADRYLGAGGIVVLLIFAVLFFFSWRRVRALLERELGEDQQGTETQQAQGAPRTAPVEDEPGGHPAGEEQR